MICDKSPEVQLAFVCFGSTLLDLSCLAIRYADDICIYCVQYAYNLYILRTHGEPARVIPIRAVYRPSFGTRNSPTSPPGLFKPKKRAHASLMPAASADVHVHVRCPRPLSRPLRSQPPLTCAAQSAPRSPKFRTRSQIDCLDAARFSNRTAPKRGSSADGGKPLWSTVAPAKQRWDAASQQFAAGHEAGKTHARIPFTLAPLAPGPRMALTAAQPPRHVPLWE
jgi:hypothetical protein